MKIALIGSEAAGKTTFLAMLSEYCRINPNAPIQMRAITADTNRYVASRLGILQRGEWPEGTKIGDFKQLRWHISLPRRKTTAELHVCDFSGQRFRQLFTSDYHLSSMDKLSEDHKQILDYIVDADLVIMLVDFSMFTGQLSAEILADNRFMVEVLFSPWLSHKQRFLLATKADLHPRNLDVRELVQKHVGPCPPEVFCSKVTAVTTEQRAGETPSRVPATPLVSEYMDVVCAKIATSTQETVAFEMVARVILCVSIVVVAIAGLIVGGVPGFIIALFVVIGLYCARAHLFPNSVVVKTRDACRTLPCSLGIKTRSGVLVALSILGVVSPLLASVNDLEELKPTIAKTVEHNYYDINNGEVLRISRDDKWGDDDYEVRNISPKAILNIQVFFRNRQYDHTLDRLLPNTSHTFKGIPDKWGSNDEGNVSVRYDVEEKSQLTNMFEMAKEAIDYVATDVPQKMRDIESAKASEKTLESELLKNVREAAAKEREWTLKRGILGGHKWKDRLEKLLIPVAASNTASTSRPAN